MQSILPATGNKLRWDDAKLSPMLAEIPHRQSLPSTRASFPNPGCPRRFDSINRQSPLQSVATRRLAIAQSNGLFTPSPGLFSTWV